MGWTPEQQQVIDYRNRNILVSAAAGSGKTAVLVERIITKITDETNPVDIDRLLVVTFTKAAAAEMRERIGNAVEKKLKEDPENENLQRQLTLIHHAQITTIDSFCLYVVRNHFQEIGLDPSFRIADTGEIKLLENDVLAETFERNYSAADNEAFLQLVDAYGNKRGDALVRDMVMAIYRSSASAPWPKEWVSQLLDIYYVEDVEQLLKSRVFTGVADYVKAMVSDCKRQLEKAWSIALSENGPAAYGPCLEKELLLFESMENATGYEQVKKSLEQISFDRLPSVKKDTSDADKTAKVKSLRDEVKKSLIKYQKDYFSAAPEEMLAQIVRLRPMVEELVRLTLEYMDTLAEKKTMKHIADFSDVEHFALQILVDKDTKEIRDTAKEFQETFEEIMIDEYQDSNQVQEAIMCAISTMDRGDYNMFMVGDVKQSIYRFRLARPELFMEKYERYSMEESREQRIDLRKNFRSRESVLSPINDIFYKIMQKDLGKVAYDANAALYPGADYYPPVSEAGMELLLLDGQDELLTGQKELSKGQLEAAMVANRIQELMEHTLVTDKESHELRRVRYSDIVILFRSPKRLGAEFSTVLEAKGIPVHMESSTGYFSAIEVQTVLAMLKLLDNPYQDIPMAAVLSSPMVGLDNEELAEIRMIDHKQSFAKCAIDYCKEAEGAAGDFWKIYERLREEVKDTPIHEVIRHILEYTGYGNYAAALPAGERRGANLNKLMEKAVAFEKTSYKGLFHFVRYIEQLQKYEVDFGEAEIMGEAANVVHIMSIHKSKGLEFPIVFLSGMSKKFNEADSKNKMVIHPDLGLGLVEHSVKPRLVKDSILKTQIANTIMQENLGEELRVLYVAMTRAKEKLIMTGFVPDFSKAMSSYEGCSVEGKALSFAARMKAKNYLDYVIPAMISYPGKYNVACVDTTKLVLDELKKQTETGEALSSLWEQIRAVPAESISVIEQKFAFTYPYDRGKGKKLKYSVSELKHLSMEQQYEQTLGEAEKPEFIKEEKEPIVPKFLSQAEGDKENKASNLGGDVVVNRGALRGTAVHRVMECLDFQKLLELRGEETCFENQDEEAQKQLTDKIYAFVREEIDRMLKEKLITSEMKELVSLKAVTSFLCSDTARRMGRAQKEGNLFREKPFIMDYEGSLVQGIIDVFWLEDKQLVVLDYKTDRVDKAEELVMRYKLQLDLYKDALGRAFARDGELMATSALIYAFHLKEVIEL